MLMHLMILAYSDLHCVDAAVLIGRVAKHEQLSRQVKVEIVQTIQESTPECPWDAND
jgi:hypothetical protein